MNVPPISEKLYTLDEYIEFEENSEIRHEFHEGILYPIEGTSLAHNEVIQNVVALLRPEFRKRGCKMAHENVKLQIIEKGKYVYPDILLTCDEQDKNAIFIVRYPSLIVEVLSKSTAPYDRSGKFNFYQTIPSIQYYLLIESRWQSVELYSRTEKESVWTYQRFSKPTEIVEFPKLNFQISLLDIYESIDIPERLSFIIDEKDEN